MKPATYDPCTIRKRVTEYTIKYFDGREVITLIRPALSKLYVEYVTTRHVTLEASLEDFVKIAHEAQEDKNR